MRREEGGGIEELSERESEGVAESCGRKREGVLEDGSENNIESGANVAGVIADDTGIGDIIGLLLIRPIWGP